MIDFLNFKVHGRVYSIDSYSCKACTMHLSHKKDETCEYKVLCEKIDGFKYYSTGRKLENILKIIPNYNEGTMNFQPFQFMKIDNDSFETIGFSGKQIHRGRLNNVGGILYAFGKTKKEAYNNLCSNIIKEIEDLNNKKNKFQNFLDINLLKEV